MARVSDQRFQVSAFLESSTEAQFQATVEEMAQWLGYMSWHDKDARKNVRGHPDLLLIGTTYPQVVYLELKRQHEKARPTNWQVDFLQRIRFTGHHAYVARPSDMDLIESILREEVEVPEIGTGKFDPRVSGLIAYEHESYTPGVGSRSAKKSGPRKSYQNRWEKVL